MKRTLSLILIIITFYIITAQMALGISTSPTRANLEGAPGTQVEGFLNATNTADTPQKMVMELQDYYMDSERNVRVYVDGNEPRGLKKLLKFDKTEIIVDPGEAAKFRYIIDIPQDAAPGTYYTAIIAGQEDPTEEIGVGVKGKTISLVNLTITGDFNEELLLSSFAIDKQSFSKGLIVFNATFENKGDVQSIPKGQITIYNNKGEQISGVYAITKTFEEQEVVVERRDELPFNGTGSAILPETTSVIQTVWGNRQVDIGKYVAKLTAYYGEEQTKFEKNAEFEIIKNFQILDFKAENSFQQTLPARFNVTIRNTGTTNLSPKGYLAIKNIFGSQKERIDFTPEELALDGGEEKIINNLEWSDGFAFGIYSAELVLTSEGDTFTNSTMFWVLSWWQIAIVVAILAILIFLVIKFTKKYNSLKKQASKQTTEETTKTN